MLDPVSGARIVAAFREAAPRARVVELAHVGHYPQLEDPPAVIEAHRTWIDDQVSS